MSKTVALLLAAGLGTRLRPYTDNWPKCLMPIQGRPLLEYWFALLRKVNINNVLVNTHYHSEIVLDFLQRPSFADWVDMVYETELLGTAGTIRANNRFLSGSTVLLVHADNLCCCDFPAFLNYHHNERPRGTLMTMMTFETSSPSSCGIVQVDKSGIVQAFYEKQKNPPGNLANAAVYLIEAEALDWIMQHPDVYDFSTEVLPHFIGNIATWKNNGTLRDIGTIKMLRQAQKDDCPKPAWPEDAWNENFLLNPIHQKIN